MLRTRAQTFGDRPPPACLLKLLLRFLNVNGFALDLFARQRSVHGVRATQHTMILQVLCLLSLLATRQKADGKSEIMAR